MEIINVMAESTVVLTFVWCIFSFVILKPLNTSITELREAIKELRKDVYDNESRRHDLEIKVAEVDQSAKSAHHRIDTLQEKVLK